MCRVDGGRMTKEHLKEALQSLACVFTDDQVSLISVALYERAKSCS